MLRRPLLASTALLLAGPTRAQSAKTLRVVMQSDLKIIDPIWTTAYIVRNHGYLIYDTLFALDEKLEPPAADGRELDDERRQDHLDLQAARRPEMARRPARHHGRRRPPRSGVSPTRTCKAACSPS